MDNITVDTTKESIDRFFDDKIDSILPSKEEFRKLLESGKRLTFYMGADVTAPRLHIGHTIPFLKMSHLQKMGHKIIFLIGDFTGRIGDPTDKSAARTKLTDQEVEANTQAFIQQIKTIFDFNNKENPPEIKFNSTWNSNLSFKDIIELASNFTVQQMIERDMFQKRLKDNKPIYLHEFLYPLIQGYDSVAMEVDGEFGGSDQTFNMLAGRTLVKNILKKEKFIITMKLLLSADGVNKMSKSIGNCIFITDSNHEKFGKIMSLPDNLLIHYFELLTDLNSEELDTLKTRITTEPMLVKKELAYKVVAMFDGEERASEAKTNFERTVQNKEIPTEIPTFERKNLENQLNPEEKILLKDFITAIGLTASNSESKRLIAENAVEIDQQKKTDPNELINPEEVSLVKVGKRNWKKLI